MSDFRDILKQADRHPSQRYFILKSIVLNNLYGVDIMEEAVEICKLRLFLKLVAQLESYDQIEPLPDIDFNIKAGNTLVGFTSLDAVRQAMTITPDGQLRALDAEQQETLDRIEADAGAASEIYDQFRRYQITPDSELDSILKQQIKDGLGSLRTRLDSYQATQYGIDQDDGAAYADWVKSHRPFHWFVEFYGIMSKGGFDVVVGNPPYVSTKKVPYALSAGDKELFSDIYGHILLQAMALTTSVGRCSMIVPLSIAFSRDFASLRNIICGWGESWFSSFDNIPAALFTGVSQRCTIWLGHNSGTGTSVAPMHRWRSAYRPCLMGNLAYVSIENVDVGTFGLPRIGSLPQKKVLANLASPLTTKNRSALWNGTGSHARLGFSQAARNFVSVFREDPPCLDASSLKGLAPSKIGTVSFSSDEDTFAALVTLSGELGFWYWLVRGDGFDVTTWLVRDYVALLDYIPPKHYSFLVDLGRILDRERNRWLVFKKNAGRYVGNFNYRGAYQITRRADLLVLDGLSRSRDEALEILEYVQRVLAINEYAGEKGIPTSVKSLFPVPQTEVGLTNDTFSSVDALLTDSYSFTEEELDFIINYDIKYRMGRDYAG